ncbi:AAA family ATPase [Leisingera sp. SS27]|uniref:AAA family ATPase n=1 Tax=Leisingera sp. SS27 TaxID=2979462 RepID=UPI00232D25E3|nr:AAA family ATPase [Leisingera sp. SS27]MDC0659182.1 AAA family ATPase [Leisingera sp. SS27]
MLITLAVSGYRSIRDAALPLEQLTVVSGANGAGKSSLYRSLRLLAEVAQGRAIASLASEGGLDSTLWAGPEHISARMRRGEIPVEGTRRKNSVALKLGFAAEDYGYAVDLGLPAPVPRTMFGKDPEIKSEALWVGESLGRANSIAERRGAVVTGRDGSGRKIELSRDLRPFDSMMTHAADPVQAPEMLSLRERMRGWRFYDSLRTDRDSPARRPAVGTRTPALAGDGADLAAAIATLREIGDGPAFDEAIEDAFPGASADVSLQGGLFSVEMQQHGLLRPLSAAELSDGTLRYVLLATALLTPRPPELMVLNEPETSLHPDLIAPLARLIKRASRDSQIIVVSHNSHLARELEDAGALSVILQKEFGETRIEDLEPPRWSWPKR